MQIVLAIVAWVTSGLRTPGVTVQLARTTGACEQRGTTAMSSRTSPAAARSVCSDRTPSRLGRDESRDCAESAPSSLPDAEGQLVVVQPLAREALARAVVRPDAREPLSHPPEREALQSRSAAGPSARRDPDLHGLSRHVPTRRRRRVFLPSRGK